MFERIKEMFDRRAQLSPEQLRDLEEMILSERRTYSFRPFSCGGMNRLEQLYYDLLAIRCVANSPAARFL